MHIEFVGVSGSGKSTIIREVEKLLEKNRIKYISHPHKKTLIKKIIWIFYLFKFVNLNLLKILTSKTAVNGLEGLSLGEKAKFLYLALHIRYYLHYTSKNYPAVIAREDNFLIWLSFFIVLKKIRKEEALKIAKIIISVKTFFVFLDTPISKVFGRQKNRDKPFKNRFNLDPDQWKEHMSAIFDISRWLLEELNLVYNLKIIKIDGNKLPEENAVIIFNKIKEEISC